MTDLIHPQTGKILFSRDELKCPATGEVRLDSAFAEALIILRVEYGVPMRVTSCCRSAAYNRQIRGHPRSLHVWNEPYHPVTGTCAIDIAMSSGLMRRKLVRIAIEQGWAIGVGTNFLHLDFRRAAGLSPVLYGYGR